MRELTTWRVLLEREAERHGDDPSAGLTVYPLAVLWPVDRWSGEPVEGATRQGTLDVAFDAGYGSSHGPQFTAWTADRVYFPVVYDGAEWVGSVPRNPCGQATEHVGGG